MQSEAARSVDALRPGDHFCGVYSSEEEHGAFISEFVRQGLQRGEKVVYLVDMHTTADVRAMLAFHGLDVGAVLESGQLMLDTSRETYLRGGGFDPDRMIADVWIPTLAAAREEGYPTVRVTGEMTWALSGMPGTERLLEYESLVNAFIVENGVIAACQYCRGRFDSDFLIDAVQVHPKVLVGSTVCDNQNHYYVPPDGLLGGDPRAATLDRWMENLTTARGFG